MGNRSNPGAGVPIRELSDDVLVAEWRYWGGKIAGATRWGAAVGAADEFRRDCERELRRRELPVPTDVPGAEPDASGPAAG